MQYETIITKIWKTGHSHVITIPDQLMQFTGWKKGDTLKLIVRKAKKER